jgi:hypothetical protein
MQEENKDMIDIDTSGPGADVELEAPKVEEVESNQEEKEEVVEQPKEEKETEKETKKDELEDYSDSVKRRINKLTKKMREAERQKEEALDYARSIKASAESIKKKYADLEVGSLKDKEEKISSSLKASYAQLAAAREANDLEAEVSAQKEIARLGYEEARLNEMKDTSKKVVPEEIKDVNIRTDRREEPRTPDPKASEWASKNRWFGTDSAMTYTAFDLHKKLVDEEGYDPQTDEYYSEIDKRIRLEFPHKFDTNEERETTKPTQTVASAKRSVKSSRKSVRLTPSQVAIAKKLGVPLEEYAKQLNTKEV